MTHKLDFASLMTTKNFYKKEEKPKNVQRLKCMTLLEMSHMYFLYWVNIL